MYVVQDTATKEYFSCDRFDKDIDKASFFNDKSDALFISGQAFFYSRVLEVVEIIKE